MNQHANQNAFKFGINQLKPLQENEKFGNTKNTLAQIVDDMELIFQGYQIKAKKFKENIKEKIAVVVDLYQLIYELSKNRDSILMPAEYVSKSMLFYIKYMKYSDKEE